MGKQFTPTDTSVAEVHHRICDDAIEIANRKVAALDIPRKWQGQVFENMSDYSNGNLALGIRPEYQGAPDRIRKQYLPIARQAVQQAIANNSNVWAGAILGEAKQGRNYFDRWQQAPTKLV